MPPTPNGGSIRTSLCGIRCGSTATRYAGSLSSSAARWRISRARHNSMCPSPRGPSPTICVAFSKPASRHASRSSTRSPIAKQVCRRRRSSSYSPNGKFSSGKSPSGSFADSTQHRFLTGGSLHRGREKSRFESKRFSNGRFLNGRFLKGSFLKGRFLKGRLLKGRLLKGRLFEGARLQPCRYRCKMNLALAPEG